MPLDDSYRGISEENAIPHSQLLRRYGTAKQPLPFWRDRETLAIFLMMAGCSCLVFRPTGIPFIHYHLNGMPLDWLPPILVLFALVSALPFWLMTRPQKFVPPLDLPIQTGMNVRGPDGKNQPAAGTVFLGNAVRGTNRQGPWVWITQDKQCQHSAYCGTTGAGKSSAFLGVVANALIQGSGIFLMDGKADLKFFQQFIALTRVFNRGYDLRFINFLNIDPNIAESFNTNTMNMFAAAPADDMYNLIVSLKSDMGKENRTFAERGESLAQSVISMLCWARDNRDLILSIEDVRDYIINLDNVFRLALGCLSDGKEFDGDPGFQMHAQSVLSYISQFMTMTDVVSYAYEVLNIDVRTLKYVSDEVRKTPIGELDGAAKSELTKQHGYAVMAFDKAFKTVSSGYFRVFGDQWGDVTIEDVIKNRRVVIIMLPSMGKAPSEVMALSKVMISNIRGMASRALGNKLYGLMSQLISNGPTKANSPFVLGFDEVGSYMQQGLDEINKQVRGLNFSTLMGFQDIPGLERHDAAVAKSALGSSNYIFFMRIQDPQNTGAMAQAMASKTYAAIVGSFQTEKAIVREKRSVDSKDLRLEQMERVTFPDLQSQPPGGAHLIAEGKVIRMQVFYVEPLSCIRPERMLSTVRRLAGWPPPDPSQVVLVTKDGHMPAKPRPPGHVPGDKPAGATPQNQGLPEKTTAGVMWRGQEANVPDLTSAIYQRFAPNLNTKGQGPFVAPRQPLFDGPDGDPDGWPDVLPPEGLDPNTRPLLPANSGSSATDPYNIWVQQLEASAERRQSSEAQLPSLVAEFSSFQGPIEIIHEFMHLLNVGMPIALRDESSIDLPAMVCGLISLCGVRAQNRRDSRTPPYVPMSWLPGEHRDGPMSDRDFEEVVGSGDFFGALPPVSPATRDLETINPWTGVDRQPDSTADALLDALRPHLDDEMFGTDLDPLVTHDGPHIVDPDAFDEKTSDDDGEGDDNEEQT